MAYKKTQPLYHRQKQSKNPGDDSNCGLLPTAHQCLRTNGRPSQGKQQKVVKVNKINPRLEWKEGKITSTKGGGSNLIEISTLATRSK
jgi:hypothetical protein